MCKTEENFLWTINRLGKIENHKYKEKCIAAKDNDAI